MTGDAAARTIKEFRATKGVEAVTQAPGGVAQRLARACHWERTTRWPGRVETSVTKSGLSKGQFQNRKPT